MSLTYQFQNVKVEHPAFSVLKITKDDKTFYFVNKYCLDLSGIHGSSIELNLVDYLILTEEEYNEFAFGRNYGRTNKSEILQTFEEYCQNPYLRHRRQAQNG